MDNEQLFLILAWIVFQPRWADCDVRSLKWWVDAGWKDSHWTMVVVGYGRKEFSVGYKIKLRYFVHFSYAMLSSNLFCKTHVTRGLERMRIFLTFIFEFFPASSAWPEEWNRLEKISDRSRRVPLSPEYHFFVQSNLDAKQWRAVSWNKDSSGKANCFHILFTQIHRDSISAVLQTLNPTKCRTLIAIIPCSANDCTGNPELGTNNGASGTNFFEQNKCCHR